jgi:hypothetical protein
MHCLLRSDRFQLQPRLEIEKMDAQHRLTPASPATSISTAKLSSNRRGSAPQRPSGFSGTRAESSQDKA